MNASGYHKYPETTVTTTPYNGMFNLTNGTYLTNLTTADCTDITFTSQPSTSTTYCAASLVN